MLISPPHASPFHTALHPHLVGTLHAPTANGRALRLEGRIGQHGSPLLQVVQLLGHRLHRRLGLALLHQGLKARQFVEHLARISNFQFVPLSAQPLLEAGLLERGKAPLWR